MHPSTRTYARTQKYVILNVFHSNKGFVNATHCYVSRTLPYWQSLNLYLVLLMNYSLVEKGQNFACKSLDVLYFPTESLFLVGGGGGGEMSLCDA